MKSSPNSRRLLCWAAFFFLTAGRAGAGEFTVHASNIGEYMSKIGPTLEASSGLMMEIAAKAAQMGGISIGMAPEEPWMRAQEQAMREPGGVLVVLARTAAREPKWRWLSVVYTDKVYAYTLKGKPVFASYAEIAKAKPTVGAKFGSASESILEGMG